MTAVGLTVRRVPHLKYWRVWEKIHLGETPSSKKTLPLSVIQWWRWNIPVNFSCFLLFLLLPYPRSPIHTHTHHAHKTPAAVSYLSVSPLCFTSKCLNLKSFNPPLYKGFLSVSHFTFLSYEKMFVFFYFCKHIVSICTFVQAKPNTLPVDGDFVMQSREALSTFGRWQHSRLLACLLLLLFRLLHFFHSF